VAALCVALPWLNPFSFGPSVMVLSGLVAWWGAGGLCLCFGTLLTTRQARWQALLWGWAVAAGLSALMGLVQYFDRATPFAPWINYAGLGQAFGNLRQRNQFATLCSIGLAMLWWWAQYARVGGRTGTGPIADAASAGALTETPMAPPASADAPKAWASAALTLALLAGATLVCTAAAATSSRTAFMQLLLLLGLAWCWRPSAPTPGGMGRGLGLGLVGFMLLAYVLAAWLLPLATSVQGSVFDRMRESPDGCASRVALYRNVLHLITQKPLAGWGWGELDYAHFMTLYTTPLAGLRFCAILDNAHNLPLHWAVEWGLPLALAACGCLLWLLLHMKPWREVVPQRQLAWAVLAMIGLHSLLEYPLWYGPFQIATLMCVWVLWAFPGQATGTGTGTGTGMGGAQGADTDAGRDRSFDGLAWRASPARADGSQQWPWRLAAGALALACAAANWNYRAMSQLYFSTEHRAPEYREQTFSKVHGVWFFDGHVDFAELSVTPLDPSNAQHLMNLAEKTLHFSPEAKVVEAILDAALLLQRADKIALYAPRYAAAFPENYARWRQAHAELALP
jgi:hypothetical protein